MAVFESGDPVRQAVAQGREFQSPNTFSVGRQIFVGADEQGTGSQLVSCRVVVKADRDLDQPLEEFLFVVGSGAPDVFEDFVRIEKFSAVKEFNATVKASDIHTGIVKRKTATDLHGSSRIKRMNFYPCKSVRIRGRRSY